MKKQMIAIVLMLTICTELLTGCGTGAVMSAAVPLKTTEKELKEEGTTVRSSKKKGYVVGSVYDINTRELIEGATVTLMDTDEHPFLNEQEKSYSTKTQGEMKQYLSKMPDIDGNEVKQKARGNYFFTIPKGSDTSREACTGVSDDIRINA